MTKDYRMMVALFRFKAAFLELAAASKDLPDLDVSDNYPFFLLDFETIAPAVAQWCDIHATRLAQNLPDDVDNPACVSCPHFREGIGTNGLCLGNTLCAQYPLTVFSEYQARAFLTTEGVDVSKITNITALHIAYVQKMEEIYERRSNKSSN